MDKTEDPSIPRDRKSEYKETEHILSRSASHGSMESAISSEDMGHSMFKKSKKKSTLSQMKRNLRTYIGLKTWYTTTMLYFFCAVALISTIMSVVSGPAEDKFDDFIGMRNRHMGDAKGFFKHIFYSNFFFAPSYLPAIIDLFVVSFCITVLLSDAQKQRIATCNSEISAILRSVPREQLVTAGHPMRNIIAQKNSSMSKILGNKHFVVKMMRVEYLKECFTLNIILYFAAFLVKRVFLSYMQADYTKLESLLDAILMLFIQFKNIVYVNHRLGMVPEFFMRRQAATLIYSVLLFFKLCVIYHIFTSGISQAFVWSCAALSYLIYRLADKINDIRVVNNVRIFVFMVAFASR